MYKNEIFGHIFTHNDKLWKGYAFMFKLFFRSIKLIFVFIICTIVFYLALQTLHREFEHYKPDEIPAGPAVKVFRMK